MNRPVFRLFFVALVIALTLPAFAQESEIITTRDAAPDPAAITLTQVADGFANPLFLTNAGDGSGRLFVLEQAGRIWIIQGGARLEAPFADFSGIVSQDILYGYSERGLLGLAFHPNYAENGLVFVNYTDRDGTTQLARYRASTDDPNALDMSSGEILLTIPQPYRNHNGGHLEFGPDGYLYMSVGDGGAAGDPLLAGQDLSNILGKIIRLDVDRVDGDRLYSIPADNPFVNTPNAVPEIWAYGVRNVWRFSFDRATGDAYIADVGQNVWEEVNFLPADAAPGANFGWNVYEASAPYTGAPAPADMVYPIAEYPHRDGDCSITGGYVYRGQAVGELAGVYLFGDYCTGRTWATYRDSSGAWQTNVFANLGFSISSFGQDEAGELYIVDYGDGRVFRIDPA
jgi:glucose/arabinose dehydrogenase